MRDRISADLFQRLPGHFRARDAEAGHALQALMALFREELQVLERDIDQLYDNWFVETCEPWVLPYIADLVGARPMREIGTDQAGLLRAYVANVLQYRQAKGTAAVVEQVARDVSGWSVVQVEFFQRVAASQHVNHLRSQAPAFADVRKAAPARRSRGPFSTLAHSAAAGTPAGWAGRYNIPHMGLFIWREAASPLWMLENPGPGYLGGTEPSPERPDPGRPAFDPLGRELPLVNRPAADLSVAARMSPRTVPAPIDRDDLRLALDAARATGTTPGRWFEDFPPFRVRLDGAEVPPARLFSCNLEKAADGTWRRPANPGEVLVDPRIGRLSLHPDDEAKSLETGFAHAMAFDIGGGPYDRRASLEKWLPDIAPTGEAPPWQIGVSHRAALVTDNPFLGGPIVGSLREAVNRWNTHATPGARGIIAVMDNGTYAENLTAVRRILLPPGARLALVAAAWPLHDEGGGLVSRRAGELSPVNRRPVLLGNITVDAADAGEGAQGSLILDGLVVSGRLLARDGGDLGALRIYNSTIGASGERLENPIQALAGNSRLSLTLDRCIVGRIDLPLAEGGMSIDRSIIGEDREADGAAAPMVLRAPLMDARIDGTTVMGSGRCRSLSASDSIFVGRFDVAYRQTGCIRFSYAPEASVLPRRYRCAPATSDIAPQSPVFVSSRFQDQGFGRLSQRCSPALLEGADSGMEMGVGFAKRDPARRANILDAVQEFAPFGLLPGLIYMS
jgi:hypothetical protein